MDDLSEHPIVVGSIFFYAIELLWINAERLLELEKYY